MQPVLVTVLYQTVNQSKDENNSISDFANESCLSFQNQIEDVENTVRNSGVSKQSLDKQKQTKKPKFPLSQ